MSFNVDTDTNYAAYLATTNKMNAEEKQMFDTMFIHNMCLQHTNSATVSSATMTTSIAAVKESTKSRKRTF